MYQLKGFSRLVIGFDVHKNHIESPYRSVFDFLPKKVTNCADEITLWVSVQSHVWLLYVSILQSIQIKLQCGILDL